eukprot:COSAG01_NODE_4780_length_4749_cov_2.137849_7_plen_268_part_00
MKEDGMGWVVTRWCGCACTYALVAGAPVDPISIDSGVIRRGRVLCIRLEHLPRGLAASSEGRLATFGLCLLLSAPAAAAGVHRRRRTQTGHFQSAECQQPEPRDGPNVASLRQPSQKVLYPHLLLLIDSMTKLLRQTSHAHATRPLPLPKTRSKTLTIHPHCFLSDDPLSHSSPIFTQFYCTRNGNGNGPLPCSSPSIFSSSCHGCMWAAPPAVVPCGSTSAHRSLIVPCHGFASHLPARHQHTAHGHDLACQSTTRFHHHSCAVAP